MGRKEAQVQSCQTRYRFSRRGKSVRRPLVTVEDTREDYGEARYVALGLLEGIVVSMVYTERGSAIRLISIRKALKHEARFFFSQIGK